MKALVLLSGGMDSTAGLAYALDKYKDAAAISFHYESKHNDKELSAAEDVVEYYKVPHWIKSVAIEAGNSTLMKGGGEIPNEEYHDASKAEPSSTVVPFRNAVFIAQAVALAEARGYSTVVIAAHATDALGFAYPDCSPQFFAGMQAAVNWGTLHKVQLDAPFLSMTKAEVVELAAKLRAPLALTWSCYRGNKVHCGRCPTCIERFKAFKKAGYVDPVVYAYPPGMWVGRKPFPSLVKGGK